MAAIRPLFAKMNGTFGNDFTGELNRTNQALPPTSDAPPAMVLEEIRKALNWILATQKIHGFSTKAKHVTEHLELVERRAEKYRSTRKPSWRKKLVDALRIPDPSREGSDIATLIALEYLAVSSLVHRDGLPVRKTDLANNAIAALKALDIDHDGTLELLAYWCRKQRSLILEGQQQTARRLTPLERAELIQGQRFTFQTDPIKERNARPLSDCLDAFVGQICLIYRWAGGSTSVPRDGRDPTAFQRFLEAVAEDCPEIERHGSLHSRARSVLKMERAGLRELGFQDLEGSKA